MAKNQTTPPFKRICVFCGSACGADPRFADAARKLGRRLAQTGVGLVYGGASIGLMAAAANGALEAGGEAIGVIPEMLLKKEVAHSGLTELHVVGSMHERKALMAELSDAFIALPGGIGTLEELFEVWTWTQLGAQEKPCGLLNVGGFYDLLLAFVDNITDSGFLRPEHRGLLSVAETPDALLALLTAEPRRHVADWIGPEEV